MDNAPPLAESGSNEYTADLLIARLTTTILGRRIELHQQVGSTNDIARAAARAGEPEGLVVLAEEQVAGRGRLGRTWTAPPGCCVLCSVLLRPRFSAQHAFYLTIAASLAIYRAVRSMMREGSGNAQELVASIKWPNDVLLNGRKVSGVLSESEFSGGNWAFSVVGFGINANLAREQFGPLKATATSLSAELGRDVDRVELACRVLVELEGLYLLLQNGQFGTVHAEWVGALETIGKAVSIAEPGNAGAVQGRAIRVDADGALVVLTAAGMERRVLVGDLVGGR